MSRRATIYDVARLAGVSHQTVSRVINGNESVRPAARDQVQSAIELLQYRRNEAARTLAGAPSNTVALLSTASDVELNDAFARGVHSQAWILKNVVVSVTLTAEDVSRGSAPRATQMLVGQRPLCVIVTSDTDRALQPQIDPYLQQLVADHVVLHYDLQASDAFQLGIESVRRLLTDASP